MEDELQSRGQSVSLLEAKQLPLNQSRLSLYCQLFVAKAGT